MSKSEEYLEKMSTFAVENNSDPKKVIGKFGDVYRWMMKNGTEVAEIFKLFDLAVMWAMKNSIKEKKFSDAWNGKLVSRVYHFLDNYRKNFIKFNSDDGDRVAGSVYNAIIRETDFPTMLYCLKLIKIEVLKGYEFSSLPKTDESEKIAPCPTAVEKEYQYADDDNEHYGEMMTYQQCKELGLKTHLLWDLDNHCYCNEWIKEENTDTVKITDDEIDELVESIFQN